MEFKKAVRKAAKARIALSGPSGSGKTYSSLVLAAGLGGKIAVIDTEMGSASLYTGLPGIPEYDTLELLAPYTPERFSEAMAMAAKHGYDTLIIDGITPEWGGVGGCLELVDQLAASKYRGNSWSAWSDVTPRHRRFIDAMLQYPGHLIATMRSKTETAQEEKNGRKTVVKLGMKSEQRDGIEYEFTAVLDITHNGHYASAAKDRTQLWSSRDPAVLTVEDGKRLLAWLNSGELQKVEPPKSEPVAAPTQVPTQSTEQQPQESTAVPTATVEQVTELASMIAQVRPGDEWEAKCLSRAGVSDWDLMPTETMAKCIEYLKKKLPTAV